MMRIIVFSDTHTMIEPCIRVIESIKEVDMIIHAGDHCSDAEKLAGIFSHIPIKYVRGNCDFSGADDELLVEADGKRIFVTHGHRYGVKAEHDYRTLKNRGIELGADAAVFGHTHVPYNENFGEITLINSGSVKHTQTFGVIEVENGKIGTSICSLKHIM